MNVRTTVRLSAVAAALASMITVGSVSPVVASGAAEAAVAPAPADGSATDQIIVTFDRSGKSLGRAAIVADAGVGARSARAFGSRSQIVKLPRAANGRALEAIMGSLAKRPGVTSVEPDQVMRAMVDDPYFPDQWSLSSGSGGQGIDVAEAWKITTGDPNLRIAVIDTGYLLHEDLADKLDAGYDFIFDSRIANDGNGRDGDASDPGDWITSREARRGFFRGCQVSDSSWHGTHVAGTIGATTNNGVGMAGINQASRILPVRVLGKCGGYTSDIVDGMRWAAGLPVTGVPANANPARVLNLSLGGGGSCSATYQDAVNDVRDAGAVVVVAAGNSAADAGAYSPASCSGVITVAATGRAGNLSYYSNDGSAVEIAAPGGDRNADSGDTVLSTLNTGATAPGVDTYVRYQGTSMAAPHVAGVVSLMVSADATLSPSDVDALIPSMVRPFPSGSTCSPTRCGAGLLDAGRALNAVAGTTATTTTTTTTPMPPPTSTSSSTSTTTSTTTSTSTTTTSVPDVPAPFGKIAPADGQSRVHRNRATLSWQTASGASRYEVCIDLTDNGVCDADAWQNVGSSTTTGVSGLGRGLTYEWQVRAIGAGTTDADGGDAWVFTTR